MYCKNCGSDVPSGSMFCQNCGQKAETPVQTTNYVQQPPAPPPMPVYAPAQQIPPVPIYAQPVAAPRKKKRHVGLWIFLSILVISTAAVVLVLGKSMWSEPKDLGIRYTQKDFNDVIQELGIHFTSDLGSGYLYDNQEIIDGSDTANGIVTEDTNKTIAVEKLNAKDYNFEFSKYEKKTIKVTDVQATAFINEVGPQFFWLTNTQVKIEPDGSVKLSSSLNVRMIIRDLFQSIEEKIPIELPQKLNIYLEGPGKFAIQNNVVVHIPKKASAGMYNVPEEYLTDENAMSFVSYFTDLFNEYNLDIYVESFYVEDGQFYFSGTVPTEIKVTPKISN